MGSGFIYVIESIQSGKRYLGSTTNPNERIVYHNNGLVKATSNFRPWKYILIMNVGDIVEARKIEYYIKRQKVKVTVENIVKTMNWYFEKKGL